MSPFQVPDGPFTIEQIMAAIREQVLDAEAEPDRGPLASDPAVPVVRDGTLSGEARAALEELQRRRRARPAYRIRSHRRWLGLLVNPVKRLIHWGSHPYTDRLSAHQDAVNDAAIAALEALERGLTGLEGHVEAKQRQLADAEAATLSVSETLVRLMEQLAAQERRLEELDQHRKTDAVRLERAAREDAAARTHERAEIRLILERIEQDLDGLRGRHDLSAFYSEVPEARRLAAMDCTRGTYADIRHRQTLYVDYFRNRPGQVLDVGCGRGEMLYILRHEGIECWGADVDPAMLRKCHEAGNHAIQADALTALRSVAPATLGGLFAAQVVEHLFPGELLELLRLARRKLAAGGVMVLETLNPSSLGVLAKNYYRDLDHKQPIHPEYLKLLAELAGFEQVELHMLHPFDTTEKLAPLPAPDQLGLPPVAVEALRQRFDTIDALLHGPQDYFIVARQGPPATDSGGEGAA